jgi:hypothetical protein
MRKKFNREVLSGLKQTVNLSPGILTENDLQHLPQIVQRYLRNAGAVGKEKVLSMRAVLGGGIRSKPEESWMKLTSVQYNFFDNPVRVFYIKALRSGIPAMGLHIYKNGKASFVVKLLGLFRIIDAKGEKLDQGETVTVFNDMCLLAPSTLISKNIQWEETDPLSVMAKFTNGNITISALLIFNERGELINFISNDRYETNGKKYSNYPWLTPVSEYKEFDGYKLCSRASADYQRPDGAFSYAQFILEEVEYNCKKLK